MERMDEEDLVFGIVLIKTIIMINRFSSSDMMIATMILKTKG